jgi:hypothetical protein
MSLEKLELRLRPADTGEVEIVVVQEADGVSCHTEPLWRMVDRFLQLCNEIPEAGDKARLGNLADALEAQAARLRAAAGELEVPNETDR